MRYSVYDNLATRGLWRLEVMIQLSLALVMLHARLVFALLSLMVVLVEMYCNLLVLNVRVN